MDDNFCSIIAGIRQGRLVFTNVQKCIVYVVSHLMPELLQVALYVLAGIPPPLTTLQLLTIDLGTDIPLGVALAWEAPEDEIMTQPPRKATERLTNWSFFFLTYLQLGLIESTWCFFLYFLLFAEYGFSPSSIFYSANWFGNAYSTMAPADQISRDTLAANNLVWQAQQNDWGNNFDNFCSDVLSKAQTAYLATVTICQIGNCMGVKTQFSSFFRVGVPNWHLWIALCIALTFTMLMTYSPIGWVIFQTAPINFRYYGIMLGGTVSMFTYNEVIKIFLRRWPNGWVAYFVKY